MGGKVHNNVIKVLFKNTKSISLNNHNANEEKTPFVNIRFSFKFSSYRFPTFC